MITGKKAESDKKGGPTKQERIANLFLLLSSAKQPLSLDYIVNNVNGYPKDSHTNRRQMFERDKKILREGGITIETKSIPGEEQYGYIIAPNELYFQLPDLDMEETAVIGLALKMIVVQDLDKETNHLAAIKFDTLNSSFELQDPILISYDPNLSEVYQCIQKGLLIGCQYGDMERLIIPGYLKFTMGYWYLIGCQIDKACLAEIKADTARKTVASKSGNRHADPADYIGIANRRTFRLDKMTSQTEEAPVRSDILTQVRRLCRDTTIPPDFPPPDNIVPIKVKIPGTRTDIIHNWLTTGGRLTASKDNFVTVEAYVSNNYKSTIPRLLASGHQIEILEPKELRKEISVYLDTYLEKSARPLPQTVAPGKDTQLTHNQDTKVISKLNRMFTIVSYIAKLGVSDGGGKYLTASIGIDELLKVFGGTRESILKEIESLAMFGLPPYTMDNLLEVFWEENKVILTLTEGFLHLKNPLRLTMNECLTLTTALKTLEQIIDDKDTQKVIRSCFEKLTKIIDTENINIDIQTEPKLLKKIKLLQGWAATHEIINMAYPSKDNTLEHRFLQIHQVIFREGRFYLDGYCYKKNDFSRFLVVKTDSLRKATNEEKTHLPPAPKSLPPEFQKQSAFIPGADTLTATVEVTPDCAHVFVPHQSTKPDRNEQGNYVFKIAVGNIDWFASLLLSADSRAKVLGPKELVHADVEMAKALKMIYND